MGGVLRIHQGCAAHPVQEGTVVIGLGLAAGRSKKRRMARMATLAVTAIAVLALPLGALATTTHTPPWADVYNGPMWSGVDTRANGDTAVSYLHSAGYTAFDDDNNTSATSSLGSGNALDDAIWVAIGHANAGQITIENGASGGPPQAGIGGVIANHSVGVSPDFSKGPKAYMYDLAYHSLSKMKLMAFIGCYTGNNGATGSPYNGNLVDEATGDQGVDSAIGFTHEIYWVPNAAGVWIDSFFYHLKSGTTVSTAADDGLADVEYQLILDYGFNGPKINGGATKITPAGYGS